MTLYESNYIRLGWLVQDVRQIAHREVSAVDDDCALEITIMERARYTTTLGLSYLFEEAHGTLRDPGLQLRVYHDARLAEVTAVSGPDAHPELRRLAAALPRTGDARWSANMLLNKWLEYCAGRGHRFATGAT